MRGGDASTLSASDNRLAIVRVVEQENGWNVPSSAEPKAACKQFIRDSSRKNPGRVYDPYSERTLRQALTLRRSASSAKPSPTFCSVANICSPLRR